MSVHDADHEVALGELVRFRQEFYGCLTARADALFELAEAVLCTEGPVRSLVDLSLAPEHRRGHGALYDGINHGHVDFARLRDLVAAQRLPKTTGGRSTVYASSRLPTPSPADQRPLLAEQGADVLLVALPNDYEHEFIYAEANIGSRSAYIDLTTGQDRDRPHQLLSGAHLVVNNHRSSKLE